MAARTSMQEGFGAHGVRANAGSALAAQDWLLLLYCAVLAVLVVANDGPRVTRSLLWIALDLGVCLVGIVLYRGAVLGARAGLLVYRAGLVGAILGSYLQLQVILPDFAPHAVDAKLLAIDAWLFGAAPPLVLERFVSPALTEWFAFFYFSYFFVLAAYVFPLVGTRRDDRMTSELTLGLVLLFTLAQTLYFVVPAFGPYHHMREAFARPLMGGMFWTLVERTVDRAGAKLDVFPSLHAAVPTFLALFSIRYRRERPLAYLWPITAFIASQIVIATVYLRWHYVVDVAAGIALAAGVFLVVPRVSART
jgi:membrane-associated phospholipid phosphatase